jgi:hypothetical protein
MALFSDWGQRFAEGDGLVGLFQVGGAAGFECELPGAFGFDLRACLSRMVWETPYYPIIFP